MREILIILMSLIALEAQSQRPILKMLFENGVDSSMYNVATTTEGTVAYNTTYKVQGASSMFPSVSSQIETQNNFNSGTKFYVSVWVRTSTTTDNTVICGNFPSGGQQGWYARLNGTTNSVYLYTAGPGGSNTVITASNAWIDNDWTHFGFWFNRDAGVARIYINKVKQTLASSDSLIRNDFPYNDRHLSINGYLDGNQGFYSNGYFDNLQIYNYLPAQFQIDSLYDHVNDIPAFELGRAESLISRRNLNQIVYFKPYPGEKIIPNTDPEEPGDPEAFVSDTLFADNLNDLPTGTITSNTIVNRWQAIMPNFREDNQSIIDNAGNKFLRSKYDIGDCTTNQGIEVGIMLDTVYPELYMDVKVCYSSNYDSEHTVNNTYGGKVPSGGVWGGNHWNVINDPWVIDTIGDLHGWSAHNGMGSGAPSRIYSYVYEIRTWNIQLNYGNTNNGSCITYTKRVKVNTPGQKNAIVATYKDGVLAQQTDTLWFQSVTQLNNHLGFIEGGVIKHSLNNCSDELIYADIDDIVIYTKGPEHPEYLPGVAPEGHTITPLSGTIATNVFPDPIMFNETRTTASGTLKSHYTGSSFHPDKEDGTTYTKVVNNAAGAKYLKFTFWHDGVNNSSAAAGMWVKVYSGVGTGGTVLYTFDEDGWSGIPTINHEYSVPTSFTIEFHPSTDLDLGFKADYYLQ